MADARAFGPKIVPPFPLPHVSRTRLKAIKDPLPVPTECHYCLAPVELVENGAVYKGINYGEWPYVYLCTNCKAYVGLHPHTDVPLGDLADSFTRDARKAAKALFFPIVRVAFGGNRSNAYAWLSNKSGIPLAKCHFAMFDEEQCYDITMLLFETHLEGEIK